MQTLEMNNKENFNQLVELFLAFAESNQNSISNNLLQIVKQTLISMNYAYSYLQER